MDTQSPIFNLDELDGKTHPSKWETVLLWFVPAQTIDEEDYRISVKQMFGKIYIIDMQPTKSFLNKVTAEARKNKIL